MKTVRLTVLLALPLVAFALGGCGGGGGAPAPNPPAPAPQDPAPDVQVNGTIETGTNQITEIELSLADATDEMTVSDEAEATVRPGDGANRIVVPFSVLNGGRRIRLGEIPLQVGMNIIELKARNGHVIVFIDGRARTVLFLGRLEVGIEMLADGTIIAPTQFELRVPTDDPRCDPPDPPPAGYERRVIFRGLAPGDWCRGRVRDRFGGESVRECQANDNGVCIINDYRGGVTAHNLSGPNSLVGFYFAEHYNLLP